MSEEKNVDICFTYNKDTRAYVEAVEKRHQDEFTAIKNDIKALIEKMQNRLPPWVMFYVSFLTLLVGGLLAKVVLK